MQSYASQGSSGIPLTTALRSNEDGEPGVVLACCFYLYVFRSFFCETTLSAMYLVVTYLSREREKGKGKG